MNAQPTALAQISISAAEQQQVDEKEADMLAQGQVIANKQKQLS